MQIEWKWNKVTCFSLKENRFIFDDIRDKISLDKLHSKFIQVWNYKLLISWI